MIAAGAIKPASPWKRYTNGGRAFCARRDPSEQTLDEPAEGVQDEVALPDEQSSSSPYAWLLKKKVVTEAGLLKPDSPWTRITNGGRACYQRRDPFEQTLEEPAECVTDESEDVLEYFR